MRRIVVASAVALLAACGDSAAPTPTGPPGPGPSPGGAQVIAGRITDLLTGGGVGGARVSLDGAPAVTTGADGAWRVDVPSPSSTRIGVTITATDYLTRETYVAWTSSARENVVIDLLPQRSPFSLAFYRQMVRDGLEHPGSLEPVRRWTTNPNIYLRTLNPKTGKSLTSEEIGSLLNSVRAAVTQLTDGLLSVGTVESGNASRPERVGTINIEIEYKPNEGHCGIAFVGSNPGTVTFNYDRCSTQCGGDPLGPELVAHEIGHALGFWHVGSGIMQAQDFVNCPTVTVTQTERLHGSIAYRRPSGNRDVDRDPESFTALTPPAGSPMIRCGRKGH